MQTWKSPPQELCTLVKESARISSTSRSARLRRKMIIRLANAIASMMSFFWRNPLPRKTLGISSSCRSEIILALTNGTESFAANFSDRCRLHFKRKNVSLRIDPHFHCGIGDRVDASKPASRLKRASFIKSFDQLRQS